MIWFDCVVVALTIVSKHFLALPLLRICYWVASLTEPLTSLPGPSVSSRHQFRTSLTCNMNRPATIYVNEIRMPFNQKRPNGSQKTIMRENGAMGEVEGGARALPLFPLSPPRPPPPPPFPFPQKGAVGAHPDQHMGPPPSPAPPAPPHPPSTQPLPGTRNGGKPRAINLPVKVSTSAEKRPSKCSIVVI